MAEAVTEGSEPREEEEDREPVAGEVLPPAAQAVADDGAEDPSEPADERDLPPSPYRPRFRVVVGALLVIALAAALAPLALMAGGRGGAVEDSEWSAWRPTEDGLAGARQIASHVAPTYRLPDGNQLVAILAGPLEFANLPAAIALRSSPQGGNVSLVEGDSVLYTLSGLGRLGAIATGKPSVERHLLLRREALELALYTFRYDRKIDLVAALLPPPPKQDPSQLMLFRREDLEPQLDVPLRATLSAPPPSVDEIDRADAARIERLTSRGLFRFSLQASQDGRALLVLDPLR